MVLDAAWRTSALASCALTRQAGGGGELCMVRLPSPNIRLGCLNKGAWIGMLGGQGIGRVGPKKCMLSGSGADTRPYWLRCHAGGPLDAQCCLPGP